MGNIKEYHIFFLNQSYLLTIAGQLMRSFGSAKNKTKQKVGALDKGIIKMFQLKANRSREYVRCA